MPLSASTHWATVPGSAAVVIASIATTSFDGAQEGALKDAIVQTFEWFADAGLSLTTSLRLADTIFMLICFLGVGLVYLIGVRGMATVRGAPPLSKLRSGFAHTLIPIAFAYLVAHYFSLFVFQEQAQFTYLLSDPLGTATTDLFGTASGGIDFKLLSANAIWYVQVGALVIGHVSASPSPTTAPPPTGATTARPRARSTGCLLSWLLLPASGFTYCPSATGDVPAFCEKHG